MLDFKKIIPNKKLVGEYDPTAAYMVDYFVNELNGIKNGKPVTSIRTVPDATVAIDMVHFYAALIIYNYDCNIGDTFTIRCYDGSEVTFLIKEDGPYYILMTYDDFIEQKEKYNAYNKLVSVTDAVIF